MWMMRIYEKGRKGRESERRMDGWTVDEWMGGEEGEEVEEGMATGSLSRFG
jgi:hypothetical protein